MNHYTLRTTEWRSELTPSNFQVQFDLQWITIGSDCIATQEQVFGDHLGRSPLADQS